MFELVESKWKIVEPFRTEGTEHLRKLIKNEAVATDQLYLLEFITEGEVYGT